MLNLDLNEAEILMRRSTGLLLGVIALSSAACADLHEAHRSYFKNNPNAFAMNINDVREINIRRRPDKDNIGKMLGGLERLDDTELLAVKLGGICGAYDCHGLGESHLREAAGFLLEDRARRQEVFFESQNVFLGVLSLIVGVLGLFGFIEHRKRANAPPTQEAQTASRFGRAARWAAVIAHGAALLLGRGGAGPLIHLRSRRLTSEEPQPSQSPPSPPLKPSAERKTAQRRLAAPKKDEAAEETAEDASARIARAAEAVKKARLARDEAEKAAKPRGKQRARRSDDAGAEDEGDASFSDTAKPDAKKKPSVKRGSASTSQTVEGRRARAGRRARSA